jgi:adenylate cyclase
MCSENTVAAATEGAFRFRELDRIAVKGKARPVTVYEVLEEIPVQISPHREQVVRHYEAGLSAYKTRDWELALRYFQAALASDPEDGPSQVYLARSNEYIENPPPAEWDFVVKRTVK